VHTFKRTDFDVANSVKWAIETATRIPCLFRGEDLLAETAANTANKLSKVALHISESFQTLLHKFGQLDGVTASDRSLFVRGLYDGMMNDARGAGETLPSRTTPRPKHKKAKKTAALDHRPALAVHPYTVALGLGKHIRFAAPLEQIKAELDRATQPALGQGDAAARA
jgi:hypothetical protein